MSKDEIADRWTVLQAAVWIRSRDLAAAAYGAEQSLPGAAFDLPGLLSASGCLKEALRRGRFRACGRQALPELTMPDEQLAYRVQGDTPEPIPSAFWQSGGEFTDHNGDVVAIAPGATVRWIDVTVKADDCIGNWQPPSALLEGKRVPLGDVLGQLRPEPEDRPSWFFGHPEVSLTGFDNRGATVTIDNRVFEGPFAFDRDNNAIAVANGLIWSAVMVGLAPVPAEMPVGESPTSQQPAPAASVQKAKATQAEHDKWFIQYREACIAAGKSPNMNEDEGAGRAALGGRYHRDRARDSRARLAPHEWRSTGKRKANEVSQL